MNEETRKQLDPKIVEWLDNVRDAKGLNRQVLEVENIKTNIRLATETLKKLKSDFWHNIFFIVLGVVIGYLPNLLNEDKTTKAIELMNTLMLEKQKQYEDFQTEARQMRLELSSLKKELDSLKSN